MADWMRADVVILDDVGRGTGSALALARMTDILIERHATHRVTLLTSNNDIMSLWAAPDAPVWDDRMVSRLMEMTCEDTMWIECTTRYRQQHTIALKLDLAAKFAALAAKKSRGNS